MIGKLKGILEAIYKDYSLIDVNGVCYIVFSSTKTLLSLPKKGQKVSINIETHVREDHIQLYGFMDNEEQEAFLSLNKISGVGTRMALAILSILSPKELATAIESQNKSIFKTVSGVGPKLAQRIITEMKDCKATFMINNNILKNNTTPNTANKENEITCAISGLTNLGYNYNDAHKIISNIASKNSELSLDELIFEGLKQIGNND